TEAMPLASDQRVTTIFERAAETAERLGVPVVVGEWGAFGGHEGIGPHAEVQLDLFDRHAWSWFYWCWEPGFAATEAAQRLRRPRPRAVAGRDLRCGRSAGGRQLEGGLVRHRGRRTERVLDPAGARRRAARGRAAPGARAGGCAGPDRPG